MDNDDDGLFGASDMPISGVTVELYEAGDNYGVDAPLASRTTDANGRYYFDDLAPGQYVVYLPAANFTAGSVLEDKGSIVGEDTSEDTDNNDNGEDTPVNSGIVSNVFDLQPDLMPTSEGQTDYPGTLPDENVNATADFGLRTICDFTASIVDRNCVDNGTPLVSTDDYITFALDPSGITPGATYSVSASTGTVSLLNGALATGIPYGSATNFRLQNGSADSGNVTLMITDDESPTCSIELSLPTNCEIVYYSIGSTVFTDLNNNAIQDASEEGIADVAMQLWMVVGSRDDMPGSDDDIQIGATQNTSAEGDYLFEYLPAGDYYLVIPDEAFDVSLADLSSSSTDIATSGSDNGVDGDDNGLQTAGDGTKTVSPTITLGNPEGEPLNAAETYQGGEQDDADDIRGDMTIDFGFYAPVAILSQVYVDRNNNGVKDPDDPPIPGVNAMLFTTGMNDMPEQGGGDDQPKGDAMTTPTNADLVFENLVPGVRHYMGVDMSGAPVAYRNAVPMGAWTPSTSGVPTYYSEPEALNSTGVRNGFNPETRVRNVRFMMPVSVGDFTWVDINRDGQQQPEEPPLEGVLVTLFDATTDEAVTVDMYGNPVEPQTTDAEGRYLFEKLYPGRYYVVFDKDAGTVTNPEFYMLTSQDQGSDEIDSDVDPNTGRSSDTPDLMSEEEDLSKDAGYVCVLDVEAGQPQTICSTARIDLRTIGASISPSVDGFAGTWTTSGTGTFDGGARFGVATTYTPSAEDARAGQVILTLTSDNPADFGNEACQPNSDQVVITILKVDCGTFPWNGE